MPTLLFCEDKPALFLCCHLSFNSAIFFHSRDNVLHTSVVEEENRWNTQESAALSGLAEELARPNRGIATQTIWYRLRNQHNVFTGSQLVSWLLSRGKAATRYIVK